MDTLRSLSINSTGTKYFIYDDYGAFPEVKLAIDTLVEQKKIKIKKYIGHSKYDKFPRKLHHYEGVICEEIQSEEETKYTNNKKLNIINYYDTFGIKKQIR